MVQPRGLHPTQGTMHTFGASPAAWLAFIVVHKVNGKQGMVRSCYLLLPPRNGGRCVKQAGDVCLLPHQYAEPGWWKQSVQGCPYLMLAVSALNVVLIC